MKIYESSELLNVSLNFLRIELYSLKMNNEANSLGIVKFLKYCYYVPSLKRVYIGNFRLNCLCLIPMFIFQYIELYFYQSIISSYLQNSKDTSNYHFFIYILYLFSMISFIFCIIEGPGYLSFDYFQKGSNIRAIKDKELSNIDISDFEKPNNNLENSGNELGIAISEVDMEKVNSVLMINISSDVSYSLSFFSFFKLPPIISNHQPPFADYIVSERRFVLTPLVFDNLNGIWIGKKNIKLFILYRIFLSIASLMICFSFLDVLINFVEDYCFGSYFLECMLIFILILIKAFFQIVLCLRIINKIAFTKYTQFGRIDSDNDHDVENLTFSPSEIIKNLRMFFGENIFCWILPTPAFQGFTDEELYSIEKKKHFLQ